MVPLSALGRSTTPDHGHVDPPTWRVSWSSRTG